MKQLFFVAALVLSTQSFSQQAEVSRDHNGSKTVKGFLSKQDLSTDTAFIWFVQNQKNFTPDQKSVQALKSSKDSINIIAFGGTWCDDTKQIFPQFYALANAAGFSDERITMLGVDRSKKSVHNLSEAFNITNVPTFIVMRNGKEVGRVIEYGKTGIPMKELGEIISASAARK